MLSLNDTIYVAGRRGMVGGSVVRRLQALGYQNIVTATHAGLDLTDQAAVRAFFAGQHINVVVLAAARVGGVHANNTYPADFILDNLLINVGTGVDCTIRELAETIARVTGFTGQLVWDSTKPDGTPRKLMDVSRLNALVWEAKIPLARGLRDAYEWFLANLASART